MRQGDAGATNREKKPLPFMAFRHDTMTLEEYKRYRNT